MGDTGMDPDGLLKGGLAVPRGCPSFAFALLLPHPPAPLEKVLNYLRSLYGTGHFQHGR